MTQAEHRQATAAMHGDARALVGLAAIDLTAKCAHGLYRFIPPEVALSVRCSHGCTRVWPA